MNNLEAALGYANRGMKIFPCNTDKTPRTKNGLKNATCDIEQIKKWWTEYPEASIGLPCGEVNGVWVLDIDMPDGLKSLAVIEKKNERIPKTLTQRTGGGGVQYFWKWNGHEIRNSTSKLGKNIDVRGVGGYVILPPSSHPSGNQYEWITKVASIVAPEWMSNLAVKPIEQKQNNSNASVSSYGQTALAGEMIKIAGAGEGTRNDTLNEAAFSLGQLVAGGELSIVEVEASLLGAAIGKGLHMKEARATIKSGIESGMQSPRTAPGKSEDYFDFSNQSNQSNQVVSEVITGNQEVIKSNQKVIKNSQETDHKRPFNLHALIGEWIRNSTGSFTTEQIDREFCLSTRPEKTNRSKSLQVYKDKNIIIKDKRIKGKWHVLDSTIEWVDLNKADDTPFNVVLPFDLHKLISIPTKSIILLAGTSNAGKTTFILEILKLNIRQEYEKIYLMSEMGDGMYKRRVSKFTQSISDWQANIKAASRSYDFEGVIQHHNQNGLTCIDFLEEVDGEYFKIPTSIRNIYDALKTGVAVIAIQKKSQSQYGKGGEATREKPVLYMTLDLLCILESDDKRAIFCALKLDKVKESIKGNMEGKELHFRIDDGCKMTVVMDWAYSSKVNRPQRVSEYERSEGKPIPDYVPYKFMTKEGVEVQLKREDFEAWELKYSNFNLKQKLQTLSEQSYAGAWMTKKSWFWQLGGYLDKQDGYDSQRKFN
ncbi:MAG TPA: bifunctional DNA primase/polymerase [Thermodesulfovibrionales bacterium]|nr:bifunctional DNA primase/polymerase [Thermodesulfovibrionales bacterium]